MHVEDWVGLPFGTVRVLERLGLSTENFCVVQTNKKSTLNIFSASRQFLVHPHVCAIGFCVYGCILSATSPVMSSSKKNCPVWASLPATNEPFGRTLQSVKTLAAKRIRIHCP